LLVVVAVLPSSFLLSLGQSQDQSIKDKQRIGITEEQKTAATQLT